MRSVSQISVPSVITRVLIIHVSVAVVLWFFFPDSPVDARFFTPEEKILAVKRVAEAKLGVKNTQFKWYQVHSSFARPLCATPDARDSVDQTCLGRSEDVAAIRCLHRCSDSEWVRTIAGLSRLRALTSGPVESCLTSLLSSSG